MPAVARPARGRGRTPSSVPSCWTSGWRSWPKPSRRRGRLAGSSGVSGLWQRHAASEIERNSASRCSQPEFGPTTNSLERPRSSSGANKKSFRQFRAQFLRIEHPVCARNLPGFYTPLPTVACSTTSSRLAIVRSSSIMALSLQRAMASRPMRGCEALARPCQRASQSFFLLYSLPYTLNARVRG